jgi:long-chain fatty acid transport protein
MPHRRALPFLLAVLTLAFILALPEAAAASGGILQFQHGGRATAQAGAFTARASDASAITYNPAAVARLDGMNLLGGLDFSNPTDEYDSASGNHRANHTIQFPPVIYFTYKPEQLSHWGFGVGLDTPVWYRTDWDTALFPGRFRTRVSELRLFELHPVAAYALDDHWSVGGGLRFLYGNQEYGLNAQGTVDNVQGPPLFFEVTGLAHTNISAVSADLAIHYDANVWGWGAVLRGPADFSETSNFQVSVRDISDPTMTNAVLALFAYDNADLSFDLPWDLRTGAWIAPYPEFRIELDLAYAAWSGLSDSDVRLSSSTLPDLTLAQPRNWNDTFSVRLGAEGDLTEVWSVAGGIAYEGSPIPNDTVEPGFARGDAVVLSLGGSYQMPELAFDVGYSYHTYSDRSVAGQELQQPTVVGTYSGNQQVWSVSARWKLGQR